jgi:hypothetical protein
VITGLGATVETAPCSQSAPGANLISFGAVLAPVGSSAAVHGRSWLSSRSSSLGRKNLRASDRLR